MREAPSAGVPALLHRTPLVEQACERFALALALTSSVDHSRESRRRGREFVYLLALVGEHGHGTERVGLERIGLTA
jgi:hypothetical protein